jgi:hypothetical protein
MKTLFLSLFITLFFAACSFKTPPNQWQIKANNALQQYQKNFLSNQMLLANNDLKRSINHAKQSSDLTTLGAVYLTQCAMEKIAHLPLDGCYMYQKITSLIDSKEQKAYQAFIQNVLQEEHLTHLDKKYHAFAQALFQNNQLQAKKELFKLESVISRLLAASLIKEHLTHDEINILIEQSSFYGYKKATLFWLHWLSFKFNDTKAHKLFNAIK